MKEYIYIIGLNEGNNVSFDPLTKKWCMDQFHNIENMAKAKKLLFKAVKNENVKNIELVRHMKIKKFALLETIKVCD